MAPVGARTQFEPGFYRGNHGYRMTASDSKYAIEHQKLIYTKKWILENWSEPDRIIDSSGISYFIYEKRSKSAPNYSK
jgi:hypothetical protein